MQCSTGDEIKFDFVKARRRLYPLMYGRSNFMVPLKWAEAKTDVTMLACKEIVVSTVQSCKPAYPKQLRDVSLSTT